MTRAAFIPWSLFALLTVTALGCRPTGLGSNLSIYGGTGVAAGKWSSAVALVRNGEGFCTGTLVAKRLVITAAHCLKDGDVKPETVSVHIGEDEAKPLHKLKVASGKYNTNFDMTGSKSQSKEDYAYLVLAEDAPDIDWVPILNDPQEIKQLLQPGKSATLVGFGETESGSFGAKHEVVAKIQPDREGTLAIGGDGKDSCSGDSGGPAYAQLPDGQWRVFGITSQGSGGKCGTGGLYARMHDAICWIQKESGIVVPGVTVCGGAVVPEPTPSPSPATEPDVTPSSNLQAQAKLCEENGGKVQGEKCVFSADDVVPLSKIPPNDTGDDEPSDDADNDPSGKDAADRCVSMRGKVEGDMCLLPLSALP